MRTKLGQAWIRRTVPWAALLLLAACAATGAAEPVELVLLHTNDVHGQVLARSATWLDEEDPPPIGGLPRLFDAVERARAEAAREGAEVLVLDGGDWFQGTPEGNLDGGRGFVAAFAALGHDAAALGNHEFDLGVEHLKSLLAGEAPRAVCANLREPATGERVDWVEPYRVVERGALTIALVGLLTPETPEITHRDARALLFQDPAEALSAVMDELPPGVDLVIPVGHIDVEEARSVARAHPEVPVVVTGHSHTFLREGVREGNTLIVQAGSKATALGRVDLRVDPASGEVLEVRARLIDLLDPPSEALDGHPCVVRCEALVARAEQAMGERVGTLDAALTRGSGPRSTVATTWVADLMRARTGADVAVHNRGGTRTELPAGPVTRRDLFELLPFDNHLVTVTLSGEELEAMVLQALTDTSHSGLDYSGLRAFVRVGESVELERIEVGGEPLDPSGAYRVTANSFIASGGDSFEMLVGGGERQEDPVLLRDLAAQAFAETGRVDPPRDARIVNVAEGP